VAREHPDDVWLAKAEFGGTEWLLSGIFSEGSRRELSYARIAELPSWNLAQRYGLRTKGDLAQDSMRIWFSSFNAGGCPGRSVDTGAPP
jgi:dihydroorotase-like cyclic amidohydrolase